MSNLKKPFLMGTAAAGAALLISLFFSILSVNAACTNPATIPTGFTAPCPVFFLSSTSVTQAQTLTLSATPQAGTDYIYTTAYVSEGTAWNPYTLQGNNAYPAYSSALASLTLSSTQLQSLSLGTHYAVVWDWLWDATANCYKGPGLNQCNTGQWRVQTFSLTSSATPTPTPTASPYTYSQSAYVSGPFISISPITLNFGSVTVGTTSAVMYATLTNTGNASLTFASDSITGDFAFGGLGSCVNPGGTLAPGASCKYSAKFTPTAVGTRTGTITIIDNASNSPQIINLTGTGTTTYTYSQSSYYAYSQSSYYVYSQSTYYAYSQSAYTYTYSQSAYTSSCTSNCYYIAANGSDANSGTSKTSPWLHAPGMTGCSGNCASKTPAAGDHFILRGGDTWHYNSAQGTPVGLPWSFVWSGASGNPIYLGVDQTWFGGASWTRPVLNMDNPLSTARPSSCRYDDSSITTLDLHSNANITVDNLEFTGKCWAGGAAGAYLGSHGNNNIAENNYFHGWTYASSSTDDSHAMIGGGLSTSAYMLCTRNVFDGSDSSLGTTAGQASGFAIYNTCSEISFNVFRHVSNGMINEANNIHDNLFEYLYEPQGSQHGNIFETNGGVAATGPYYFYNNVMRHTNEGVGIWAETVSNPFYFFNNVSWHYRENTDGTNGTDGTNCYMITVNLGSTSPNAYIYNNTFDSPCGFRTLDQTEVGAAQSVHPSRFFQNNHYIGYSGGITSTYGGTGTVNDQGSEIFQSESTANGQGYTTSNNYAPASTSGATVGTGSNLTSFCNGLTNATAASACKNGISAVMYDAVNHVAVPVTSKARPSSGAWDAGAYQF